MMRTTHILLGGVLLIGLASCGGGTSKIDNTDTPQEARITLRDAPKFNADSAYQFVKAQVDFGPRVPNTEAHRRCAAYLVRTLKNYGWLITEQDFEATAYNGEKLKSKNIIAAYNPQAPTRILLGAHWDTRPYNDKEVSDPKQYTPIDGANDGASGVGVLLEIARVIAQAEKKPDVGIDIIFFDSEDYGQPEDYKGEYKQDAWCLGAQYWARNKHKADYQAYYGILLDMVGAKDATFYREGTSVKYAGEITQRIWQIAKQLGYGKWFVDQVSSEITDDHYYVNTIAKIPMLDIIEYEPETGKYFGHYHHTRKDNMDIIDRATLQAVGQTVLQTLYNETAQ